MQLSGGPFQKKTRVEKFVADDLGEQRETH